MEAVHHYACSLHSTLIIENLFNRLRSLERKALTGKLGLQRSWHASVSNGVLPEFGRPMVEISEAAKAVSPGIVTPAVFRGKVAACSFPKEELRGLTSKKKTDWPNISPETAKIACIKWVCWQKTLVWQQHRGWQSSLWERGVLATQTDSEAPAKLVIKVTDKGFISYKTKVAKIGNVFTLPFTTKYAQAIEVNIVEDHSKWRVVPVRAVAPCAEMWQGQDRPAGVRYVIVGKLVSLVRYAASQGLRQLSEVHLQWLLETLPADARPGVEKSVDEQTFAAAMIKAVSPGVPDDEGAKAVDMRGKALSESEVQADGDLPLEVHEDMFLATLDEDDYAEELPVFEQAAAESKKMAMAVAKPVLAMKTSQRGGNGLPALLRDLRLHLREERSCRCCLHVGSQVLRLRSASLLRHG